MTSADTAPQPLRLRLYVLRGAPSSEAAVANLNTFIERHLAGRHELEVINVRDEPFRALSEGALVVPTLVLMGDRGNRTLVGDLSDTRAVLNVLGIGADDDT